MNVGFFSVLRRDPIHYKLAELLIQSVHRHMPQVQIHHFTDETSPAVPGTDAIWRRPNGPMLGLRLEHYSQCTGDWLFVDTDVLIRKNVQSIFDDPTFDIAISDRNWPHIPTSIPGCPYNTGVVFSRSPLFWKEVHRRWLNLPQAQRDWLSEQRVVGQLISERQFNVKILPGMTYNYPPDGDHSGPDAAILHFKGVRKELMLKWDNPDPEPVVDQRKFTVPSPLLRVFIGYDSRQPVAFHVAAHSVIRRSSTHTAVTPLCLFSLPITRRGLTEFTYTRFLVPFLSDYTGISIFMDSDILCLGDVAELLAYPLAYPEIPVFVVHHPDRPYEDSSIMVFNNALCRILTSAYVEDTNHALFDLRWAGQPGLLPKSWNHLIDYDTPNPSAKLLHYTKGIPIWPQTNTCDRESDWHQEFRHMISTCSFDELMGKSVHTLVNHGER